MPVNETGHARNVEHFATLISFVGGYGVYKPSNPAIELVALQAKLGEAQGAIDGVTTAMAPSKMAVNDRENKFAGIRKLVTRVVNSFAASGAASNLIDDAKGFKRKLDGVRAGTLPKDDPNTTEDESAAGNSVSQQSYTQLIEHFDNLIELLSASGTYNPNETELQIASLQALSTDLKAANAAVTAAFTPFSNARLTRNNSLYGEGSGLFDLAGLVKKYVKSLFGADSPEFSQISALKFTNPR